MVFGGIIEEIGTVTAVDLERAEGTLTVACRTVLDDLKLGDSIAVNGVCLTATDLTPEGFTCGVMAETVRLTNLHRLAPGSRVNLERPLRPTDRIGGHVVQGHVDGAGAILDLIPDGDAKLVTIETEPRLMRYVVRKGYVAIDGASLTVVERRPTSFTIGLIPFTQEHTIIGGARPGDVVNVEVDILGKYIEQFMTLGKSE